MAMSLAELEKALKGFPARLKNNLRPHAKFRPILMVSVRRLAKQGLVLPAFLMARKI
jgi:hypothetical protein